MSNRYEAAGVTSAAPTAGSAFAEIRNGSARRLYVEEIGVFLGAATQTNVALSRANAQGAGGTALVGMQEDPSAPNAAASLVMATFTTAPTFTAAAMLRRAHLPAAIGAGLIWNWPASDRLIIPPSGSLAIWTPVVAGALTISTYAVWTE